MFQSAQADTLRQALRIMGHVGLNANVESHYATHLPYVAAAWRELGQAGADELRVCLTMSPYPLGTETLADEQARIEAMLSPWQTALDALPAAEQVTARPLLLVDMETSRRDDVGMTEAILADRCDSVMQAIGKTLRNVQAVVWYGWCGWEFRYTDAAPSADHEFIFTPWFPLPPYKRIGPHVGPSMYLGPNDSQGFAAMAAKLAVCRPGPGGAIWPHLSFQGYSARAGVSPYSEGSDFSLDWTEALGGLLGHMPHTYPVWWPGLGDVLNEVNGTQADALERFMGHMEVFAPAYNAGVARRPWVAWP